MKRPQRLEYRDASPGYWVTALLPTVFMCTSVLAENKFEEIGASNLTPFVIISYNSMLLRLLHYLHKDVSEALQILRLVNVVFSLFALIYCFVSQDDLYKYISHIVITLTFPFTYEHLIRSCPKNFTPGEAILVTSSFVYAFWSCSQKLVLDDFSDLEKFPSCQLLNIIIQVAFLVTLLLIRILVLASIPKHFWPMEDFYCIWALVVVSKFIYKLCDPANSILFLVQWFFTFIFQNTTRVFLLIYWAVLFVIALIYVKTKRDANATTTSDRKFFHVLVILVYIPAIIADYRLIYFCSVVVLYVFLLLEVIRSVGFEIFGIKIGEAINNFIAIFRDSRDSGPLILTPIYLLVGCSLPLWLTGCDRITTADTAASLTGVLSIGIGDTVASVVGSNYGIRFFKGSHKTMEGTVSSIFAQLIAIVLMSFSGDFHYNMHVTVALMISSVINAVTEAFTDQIDNLVVPLVAFVSFKTVMIFFNMVL